MKAEVELHARITPVEELIRNDGGVQAVPPGRVIVTLYDGTQFPMARGRFEALVPGAVLDAESMSYVEAEGDEPDVPPTQVAPFDPTAHPDPAPTRSVEVPADPWDAAGARFNPDAPTEAAPSA